LVRTEAIDAPSAKSAIGVADHALGEPTVKLPLAIGLWAAATALSLAIARAESWCIRDAAGVTYEICAFSSAQDCIRAALVGPSGGIVCAPERGGGVRSGQHVDRGKRHAPTDGWQRGQRVPLEDRDRFGARGAEW
jgi:hypothetical protein